MTTLAPTLGPQVANFVHRVGVHGPGDKMGDPFRLSPEELGFLYSVYELKEDQYRAGQWRRQYRQGVYCRRKGLRKSEFMALVTLAEFDGPVRFSGQWAKGGEVDEWGYVFSPGEPIGQRVKSPEIPVVATTEDQAERLVWGVIRYIFSHSPLAERYKVQNDIIFFEGKKREEGWLYLIPPTQSDAADGAKPTFIPREEAHLWTSKNLRDTADVLDRNLIKRLAADPWTMDATTTYAPGEGSVLETSVESIAAGDASILYDYRAASLKWDLSDDDEWVEAVREASGDAWAWTNVDGMRSLFLSPRTSIESFRRYQLNQPVADAAKPFDGHSFDTFTAPDRTPAPGSGARIVLFLDGSLTRDATALVAWWIDEDRPHLWLPGLWERPDGTDEWRVPRDEVVAMVDDLVRDYDVVTLAADADRYWGPQISAWEVLYGADRVVGFPTRSGKLMTAVIERWAEDWRAGIQAGPGLTPWTHDGDRALRRHLANAVVESRGRQRVLAKETEGRDDKIDAAVAAIAGYALIPDARLRQTDKPEMIPWVMS